MINLASTDPLHEYQCSLDFYEDFQDDQDLNETTDVEYKQKNAKDTYKMDNLQLNTEINPNKEIGLQFEDQEDYVDQWMPLFLTEVKAQIIREAVADRESPYIFMLKSITNQVPFRFFDMSLKEGHENKLRIFDFVVLTLDEPQLKQDENLTAVVDSISDKTVKFKLVLNEKDNKWPLFQKHLNESSEWYIQKLCNQATIHREYQSLRGVKDLNLSKVILSPQLAQAENYDYFTIPEKLYNKLKPKYNDSQFKAIRQSLKKEGITQIQGPPGTGKTSTILGILSVLLGSRQKRINIQREDSPKQPRMEKVEETLLSKKKKDELYKKAMPWLAPNYVNWRDDVKQEIKYIVEKEKMYPDATMTDNKYDLPPKKPDYKAKPEKILICAPSNAAIDEVVRVLDLKGLYDEDGNENMPYFIRIGPNYSRTLEKRALEYILQKELNMESNQKEGNSEFEIRQNIIKRAKIICTTLSVAGSQILLSSGETFDTVIIDEAAQAVEISTLIPLKYNCKRLILIGDPKQLPATIFSKKCTELNYDRSLFQRLQKVGYKSNMLKYQYRMNPIISKFISDSFYMKKLQNFENIMDLIGNPKIYESPILQPIVFFHIEGDELIDESSFYNSSEVAVISSLYNYQHTKYKNDVNFERVGVISAYSGQVKHIKKELKRIPESLDEFYDRCPVEVNTVDGFQGREKDIIIFSTVRSFKDQDYHRGNPKSKVIDSMIHNKQELVDLRKDWDSEKDKELRDQKYKQLRKMEYESLQENLKKANIDNQDDSELQQLKTIGFLKDRRRMNVSLSRARLTLAVVGNVRKLYFDRKWRDLVEYAIMNNTCYNCSSMDINSRNPYEIEKVASSPITNLFSLFEM